MGAGKGQGLQNRDWLGTAKLHFIKVGLKRVDSSPPLCCVLPGHVHVLSGPLASIVYQGGWRVRVRGKQGLEVGGSGAVSEPVDGHAPHPRGWKEEEIHLQNLPGASVYPKVTAGAAPVLAQMTAASSGRRGAEWGSAQPSRPGENIGRWGEGTGGWPAGTHPNLSPSRGLWLCSVGAVLALWISAARGKAG